MKIETSELRRMIVDGVSAAYRANFPERPIEGFSEWLAELDPDSPIDNLPTHALLAEVERANDVRTGSVAYRLSAHDQRSLIVAEHALRARKRLLSEAQRRRRSSRSR